jgi:hypothetical protein
MKRWLARRAFKAVSTCCLGWGARVFCTFAGTGVRERERMASFCGVCVYIRPMLGVLSIDSFMQRQRAAYN